MTDLFGNTNFYISLNKEILHCPTCKTASQTTNGTQTVKLHHPIVKEKNIEIHFKKYRYKCTICNKTFIQPTPLTVAKSRVSDATKRRIMDLAKDPRMTFKLISDDVNLTITSVINIFYKTLPTQRSTLPFVLSIDEVYLGRKSKKKYAVVLMDFQTGYIIDLIYGRSVEDCMRGLDRHTRDERMKVKYLSTDMYQGFHRLAKSYFPSTEVCVDSFHVVKLINESFQKLLISKMKCFDDDSIHYYLLKNKRHLLLKNKEKIEWFERSYNRKLKYYISNGKLLEMILDINSEIEELYKLKERYLEFNSMKFDKELKDELLKKELDEIIIAFSKSSYSGYNSISRTLKKNYEYIINSFTRINGRRISNGPIESRNATIKMIIKTSGGYRNFEHLRERALYVLNYYKTK